MLRSSSIVGMQANTVLQRFLNARRSRQHCHVRMHQTILDSCLVKPGTQPGLDVPKCCAVASRMQGDVFLEHAAGPEPDTCKTTW